MNTGKKVMIARLARPHDTPAMMEGGGRIYVMVQAMEEIRFGDYVVVEEGDAPALPVAEKKPRWNGWCRCGHAHDDHGFTASINYTAGRCKVCECRNFIHDEKQGKN